jgi:hypothetical protein
MQGEREEKVLNVTDEAHVKQRWAKCIALVFRGCAEVGIDEKAFNSYYGHCMASAGSFSHRG